MLKFEEQKKMTKVCDVLSCMYCRRLVSLQARVQSTWIANNKKKKKTQLTHDSYE